MNILIIGSGAREHAILWKLLQSPKVSGIWVAPGNAGTGIIARNLDISTDDFPAIARAVSQNGIDLVVVGPEVPLSKGIVDYLEERGIPTFGPTQAAARIESSKAFAKELMLKHGIPCARSETFDSPEDARAYIRGQPLPVVVKADGLAAGKGVVVATTLEEADLAIEVIMEQGAFGEAGDRVVVEEFMEGYEVSLLAFTDGETVVPMVPAQDFKRVHDGDQGPNTGGMGSYSPPSFFGLEMVDLVMRTILEPTVRAMAQEGAPYKGVLYAGLMVTAEGPKVVEFNCRFGDPETQVILPRLKSDLLETLLACRDGSLGKLTIEWKESALGGCVGVVMASAGYPGEYATGYPVTGLDTLDEGVLVFHAGTRARERGNNQGLRGLLAVRGDRASHQELMSGDIETAGGRVLTVVATGPSVAEARRLVYENLPRIHFEGAFYRTDIASKGE